MRHDKGKQLAWLPMFISLHISPQEVTIKGNDVKKETSLTSDLLPRRPLSAAKAHTETSH